MKQKHITAITVLALAFTTAAAHLSPASAQEQTYGDSYIQFCNELPTAIAAQYTLVGAEDNAQNEIFLRAHQCQDVTLAGFTGQVRISARSFSKQAFTEVTLSADAGKTLRILYAPKCQIRGSAQKCIMPSH